MNEHDQLVTCYTKEFGKLKLLAKGFHRSASRLKGNLDVCDLVEFIVVPGRHRAYIRSAVTLSKFARVRTDLARLSLAFLMLELVHKGTPFEERDERVWDILCGGLQALNEPENTDIHALRSEFIERCVGAFGFEYADEADGRELDLFLFNTLGMQLHTPKFMKEMLQ